jgi:hypothetical protein
MSLWGGHLGSTLVVGTLLTFGLVVVGAGTHAPPSAAPGSSGGVTSAPPSGMPTDLCGAPGMTLTLSPTTIPQGQASIATAHIYTHSPSNCTSGIYYAWTGAVIPGGQHYGTSAQFIIPTGSSTPLGLYQVTVTAYLPSHNYNSTASAQAALQVVA